MHPGLYHIFNQFTISQYLQYRPKDHSIWPFLPGRDLWMSGVMTLGQHKTHVAILSEHLLFMNRTSFTNKTMKCKNLLKGEFYIRIFFSFIFKDLEETVWITSYRVLWTTTPRNKSYALQFPKRNKIFQHMIQLQENVKRKREGRIA